MSSKKEKKQKKQKNVGSESHPKSTTKMSKVSKKRKNESESESTPGETAQKTSRKQATQIASQKRKKFESESESSSAPKRRSSYGMEDLPSSASLFKTKDMEALRVNFCEAPAENAVIPDVEDDPYVSSDSEFVINMEDDNIEYFSILVVEDKHLKNVGPSTGFGETQISAEVLACVSENIRSLGKRKYADQMLWVVRVISTYVTFYKAEIPASSLANRSLTESDSNKSLIKDDNGTSKVSENDNCSLSEDKVAIKQFTASDFNNYNYESDLKNLDTNIDFNDL
ncbi:hypothetical protein RhiirA4_446693 [Rhizophagus irregularis]|uniref:Uncharacterized protein n=1 Tax=Rhizophagus irregularis TaxID=588596 RepID=A0A2I1GWZ7_9GLOM|nr:hypothetical protein RhiirA4_446693 [Rhizophagus irregularis]